MRPLYLRANGLKTLTSKNARWPVVHTPLALMSKRASEDVFADFGMMDSPDNAVNAGSTHTSLHTSLRRLVVMFLIALCLFDTNPPFLHACKCVGQVEIGPQTHFDGIRVNGQLYLRLTASQNSCFVNA